jgi:L-glyceraldehyde 3-phosphate reductase
MTFRADEYQRRPGRYEAGMPYRRCGRSGWTCRRSRSAVAQLRRRRAAGAPAGHPAPRLRPGRHPLRPREQLRPALRQRRAQLRHDLRPRLPALPRRADHLDQGRLRHVARPLRPGRRLAQVRHRVAATSRWQADGPGLRRHLLQPPLRRDDPARGDDGALDSLVRSGKALYVGISSYSGERTREAVAILREMGTPLLIHQPSYSMLNRWIEEDLLDVLDEVGGGLHRLLAARSGHADDKYLERHPRGFACGAGQVARPGAAHRGRPDPRAGAQRHGRSRAGSRWPRWRWPGRCATRGSPRCSSVRPVGRAARRQPRMPSATWTSPTTSSRRSTSTRSRPASTCGARTSAASFQVALPGLRQFGRPVSPEAARPDVVRALDATPLGALQPGVVQNLALVWEQDAAQEVPQQVSIVVVGHTWRVSALDGSRQWFDPTPAATVELPLAPLPAV